MRQILSNSRDVLQMFLGGVESHHECVAQVFQHTAALMTVPGSNPSSYF